MIRKKDKPGRLPKVSKIPKILVVEDEIQMRFYLMVLVKSAGFEPILAKDGVQGLDVLSRIKPAAIILDIMMPRKGGARVYQEIKTNPEWRTIPVLFFSGVDRKSFFHYIKMLNVSSGHEIPEPEYYVEKDTEPECFKELIRKCVRGDVLSSK